MAPRPKTTTKAPTTTREITTPTTSTTTTTTSTTTTKIIETTTGTIQITTTTQPLTDTTTVTTKQLSTTGQSTTSQSTTTPNGDGTFSTTTTDLTTGATTTQITTTPTSTTTFSTSTARITTTTKPTTQTTTTTTHVEDLTTTMTQTPQITTITTTTDNESSTSQTTVTNPDNSTTRSTSEINHSTSTNTAQPTSSSRIESSTSQQPLFTTTPQITTSSAQQSNESSGGIPIAPIAAAVGGAGLLAGGKYLYDKHQNKKTPFPFRTQDELQDQRKGNLRQNNEDSTAKKVAHSGALKVFIEILSKRGRCKSESKDGGLLDKDIEFLDRVIKKQGQDKDIEIDEASKTVEIKKPYSKARIEKAILIQTKIIFQEVIDKYNEDTALTQNPVYSQTRPLDGNNQYETLEPQDTYSESLTQALLSTDANLGRLDYSTIFQKIAAIKNPIQFSLEEKILNLCELVMLAKNKFPNHEMNSRDSRREYGLLSKKIRNYLEGAQEEETRIEIIDPDTKSEYDNDGYLDIEVSNEEGNYDEPRSFAINNDGGTQPKQPLYEEDLGDPERAIYASIQREGGEKYTFRGPHQTIDFTKGGSVYDDVEIETQQPQSNYAGGFNDGNLSFAERSTYAPVSKAKKPDEPTNYTELSHNETVVDDQIYEIQEAQGGDATYKIPLATQQTLYAQNQDTRGPGGVYEEPVAQINLGKTEESTVIHVANPKEQANTGTVLSGPLYANAETREETLTQGTGEEPPKPPGRRVAWTEKTPKTNPQKPKSDYEEINIDPRGSSI